jgi:hypothetical protein
MRAGVTAEGVSVVSESEVLVMLIILQREGKKVKSSRYRPKVA